MPDGPARVQFPLSSSQMDGTSAPWSLPTRIAFRLSFLYLLPFATRAICFDFGITKYFLSGSKGGYDSFDPWAIALPWICRTILHVPYPDQEFPDSDSIRGLVFHAVELAIAILGALIWSILDRKRPSYRRLYGWFHLYLRFVLAATLFSYGFDKVIPLQFGSLTASRLVPRVGDLSLFDLIWTTMAASKPYTIFSGALEVVAGALLIVPQLEMLGALLSIAVMSNVFVLNLAYEIPVKVFSGHLLLVSIFLAAPALARILQLLVLRQSPAPIPTPRFSGRKWIQLSAPAMMAVLSIAFCALSFAASRLRLKTETAAAEAAAKSPLYGVWEADSFAASGAANQSLFTPKLEAEYGAHPGQDSWERLSFESPKEIVIQLRNRVADRVEFQYDPTTGKAIVSDSDDPAWKAQLLFQLSTKDALTLKGSVNGVPIAAQFHRVDISKFRLLRSSR